MYRETKMEIIEHIQNVKITTGKIALTYSLVFL